MNTDIKIILAEIAQDLRQYAQKDMEGKTGINTKVMKNTLAGSDLQRDVEYSVSYSEPTLISTLFNYYMQWVNDGRKPSKGKRPPIDVIVKWMMKKRIKPRNGTIRQVAFLISRAIWRDGYDGRPVIDHLLTYSEEQWDKVWSDKIFNAIIKEINEFFDR